MKGILASALGAWIGLSGAQPAGAGAVLDNIQKTGVMRMPSAGEWAPYSYKGPDGEMTGFDVEVAREVAKRMGVKLDFVYKPDGSVLSWEEQTDGRLWKDRFDIVIGSMTPTAKRAEHIDFPVVYYYAMGALCVHKDNTTIHVPSDASGKRIGALKTANYELYLRHQPFGIVGMEPVEYKIQNPIVVTFDDEEGAFKALAKGDGVELDGLINYLPVIMDYIKHGQPFKVIGQPLYRVPQSVAIQPGDPEFAALLKKIVDDMRKDGTLSALSVKFLDLDMTSM